MSPRELQRQIDELAALVRRVAEREIEHQEYIAAERAEAQRIEQQMHARESAKKEAKRRYERSPAGLAERIIEGSSGGHGQTLGDAIASMVIRARKMNGEDVE